MKQGIVKVCICMVCVFVHINLFAQYLPKSIEPYHINITYDKTCHLIFPAAIKSVDRGSASLLVQKAGGVENILQVKGSEQDFKETNLTVITADGRFYSFTVNYSAQPAILNYSFVGDSSEKAVMEGEPLNQSQFVRTANSIKSKRHSLHRSVWQDGIKLSINNVFSKNGLLWIELSISNQSSLSFTPNFAHFYIRNSKTVKRTAIQENEIIPLYQTDLGEINTNHTELAVFAFRPFSIGATKEFVVQASEDGNRTLTLHLNHHTMHKVKSLE